MTQAMFKRHMNCLATSAVGSSTDSPPHELPGATYAGPSLFAKFHRSLIQGSAFSNIFVRSHHSGRAPSLETERCIPMPLVLFHIG